MKGGWKLFLFLAIMIFFGIPAGTVRAEDTDWQNDYTYTLDESAGTITLSKYNGTASEVTIPAEAVIAGKSYVTVGIKEGIFNGLFYNNTTITSVVLPDTIIEIPAYSFYGCTSLSHVTFPAYLQSIGIRAFYKCELLTELNFGSALSTIGENAFWLTYHNPKIDTEIHSESPAIYSYNWVGSYRNPIFPPNFLGAEELADYTYTVNGNDHSVHLTGYSGTDSDLIIPGSVYGLGEIWSVTEIGNKCFSGNRGITSVTIPDTVTTIGEQAFYYCLNLGMISGGNGVTSVGNYAFYYYRNNDGVYEYKPTVLDSRSEELNNYPWRAGYRGIFYKTALADTTWQDDWDWYIEATIGTIRLQKYLGSETDVRVPAYAVVDSVYYPTGINGVTFKGTGITSFSAEEGVLVVSLYCLFENCTALETVDFSECRFLPDSIIVRNAFQNCSELKEVNFSGKDLSKVSYDISGFFTGCNKLTRITVPSGVSTSYRVALPGTFYEIQEDGSFGTTGYTDLMKAPVNAVLGRTASSFTIRLPVSVELTGENGIMSGDIMVNADTDLADGKRLVFSFYDMRLFAEHGIMFFSELTPRQLEWTGESHNIGGNIHLVTETLEPGEYLVQLNFLISLE